MSSDTYPHWVFDTSPLPDPHGQGEAAVRFLCALRHPKTGKPFQLDAWQERIVRRIFGDTLSDGTRRIKNVIMLVSRGARKTSLTAALALLMTVHADFRVHAGQVVLAAHDREQARIGFEEATGLVAARRKLGAAVRIRNNKSEVVHTRSRATLKAVSSDAAAQNGRTPNFVVFDEVHAWKRRDLYDVLRTGLSKSENTLSIVISQAGRGAEGIAHEVFDYGRKVARGEIHDEGTLPILFENPPDADPFDEASWHRANPGLARGYPNLTMLRQFAREAASRPAMLAKFKNDHLGIWLESNDTPWLELGTWDVGAEGLVDLDERTGETCWLGVDLGRTDDLTAIVAAFRDQDGGFSVYPLVFAPEETIAGREDVPYRQWTEAGHITPSPGAVTDYAAVEDTIRSLCKRFDVAEICFDPWSASQMMQRLGEEGLPVYAHRQGYQSMSEPMRAFERAVVGRRLRHGGNPLLRWCVGNVIVDMDPAGGIKPNKRKSKDKIDPAVAAVMALGRAEYGETGKSIYDSEAKRPHGLEIW
ncbi:terminase large subunit [Methylobacterium oryzisoli]|uniref:terminase large subunit n=1 Tax=Methylobacterium oryzisoli TaxID=3385502 RepID=UPI00397E6034